MMAEPGGSSNNLFSGEDLLAAALGQSGLDLEEDYGIAPGNVLSQAWTANNIFNFLDDGTDLPSNVNFSGGTGTFPFSVNDFANGFNPASALEQQFRPSVIRTPPSYVEPTTASTEQLTRSLPQQSSLFRPHVPVTAVPNPAGEQAKLPAFSSPGESLLATLLNGSNRRRDNTTDSILPVIPPTDNTPLSSKKGLSKSVLSSMWHNDEVLIPKTVEDENSEKADAEEEEEEEEELGYTDTYADYMPSKLKIGLRHPDPVVETSSLSSVSPPDVRYKLALPEEVHANCHLSALQLEAIVYSCQQHDTFLADGSRAGFLIGDGAGVGKGRTVAGVIYENYLCGRKRAIWLSVSNDLKYDAVRDLRDIGCHAHVYSLNKFKYDAKISSKTNGSVKKGVVFSTYSSLIGESQGTGKYTSRMKQLLHWCGDDFDGVIILDECHKAKNLVPTGSSKPTKTGLTVVALQTMLPKARVVYCSATGASEPKNMAYMIRLGIWGPGTPFPDFSDFIQAVERRGVGAMEIVAMDMKLRGMYMARQLSFTGVAFEIRELSLAADFVEMYNAAVSVWVEAREKFEKAAELMDAEGRTKKSMWGQFWSSHQRFFKYLCIASKVRSVVNIAKEAIDMGKDLDPLWKMHFRVTRPTFEVLCELLRVDSEKHKVIQRLGIISVDTNNGCEGDYCIVIGLQSTGEARTLEQLEEAGGELTDFVSTAKGVLQSLIEKHFPAPNRKKMADIFKIDVDSDGNERRADRASPVRAPKKRKRTNKSAMQAPKPKKVKSLVAKLFNLSSGSDSSDDDSNSDRDGKDESENGSGEKSADSSAVEEDFNPFGGSGSEDDAPWLNRKVKKTSKKVIAGMPAGEDPSFSALAAAGLKVGNLSWSRPHTPKFFNGSPSHHHSRSNSPLTTDPLSRVSTVKDIHHSASAPVLSSLLTTSGSQIGGSTIEQCLAMKQVLLEKVERLGPRLPPNTLDELIDELGGPENVSEMTGRKGRVVTNMDGSISYEARNKQDVPIEMLNLYEKKRFMDGLKLQFEPQFSSAVVLHGIQSDIRNITNIAIISEAASSGISLQADRRARNQRRRVHITLELPWSADKAIQQFGRTHRSNQVSAPEYLFLISELAGERRFASIVAKRLESLGALTHGDRRATETQDLSRYNFDNKYGRAALEAVMKSITGQAQPMVKPPNDYRGNFFGDVRIALVGVGLMVKDDRSGFTMLEKDFTNMSRFLNRILGITVDLQNRLFDYFVETLAVVIQEAKRTGRWDEGILDLGSHGEEVIQTSIQSFVGSATSGPATTALHTVAVERGMSWDEAFNLCRDLTHDAEGFYLSNQIRNDKRTAVLVRQSSRGKKKLVMVYRPNTGAQTKQETMEDIKKKYKKVAPDKAQDAWRHQYDSALSQCVHAYWKGNCKRSALGLSCAVGLRRRTYHILSGSVLSAWSTVERVLAGQSNSKIQIIRCKKSDDSKIVGCLIPSNCVPALTRALSTASSTEQNPVEIL